MIFSYHNCKHLLLVVTLSRYLLINLTNQILLLSPLTRFKKLIQLVNTVPQRTFLIQKVLLTTQILLIDCYP